jgi:predicted ABC-type ATPase
LFFLWLPRVELAIARVAQRVEAGGHSVSEVDIRRRFTVGMENFWNCFRPYLDEWRLFNASYYAPELIASKEGGTLIVERRDEFESFIGCAAN